MWDASNIYFCHTRNSRTMADALGCAFRVSGGAVVDNATMG
jgi:hypothetical protein